MERESIRTFLNDHAPLFRGRVLDYGAGRQPYQDIVDQAGGVYIPYDRSGFPANVSGADVGPDEDEWGDLDAIVCNQVVQYIGDVEGLLGGFCDLLRGGDPGVLVLTGPTNWPEVEPADLHRFTTAGIKALLVAVGFRQVDVRARAYIEMGDLRLSVGYGAVAFA